MGEFEKAVKTARLSETQTDELKTRTGLVAAHVGLQARTARDLYMNAMADIYADLADQLVAVTLRVISEGGPKRGRGRPPKFIEVRKTVEKTEPSSNPRGDYQRGYMARRRGETAAAELDNPDYMRGFTAPHKTTKVEAPSPATAPTSVQENPTRQRHVSVGTMNDKLGRVVTTGPNKTLAIREGMVEFAFQRTTGGTGLTGWDIHNWATNQLGLSPAVARRMAYALSQYLRTIGFTPNGKSVGRATPLHAPSVLAPNVEAGVLHIANRYGVY